MYQKLTIVGNLGRDPEMRYLPDGTAVTNLNVATSRKFADRDGQPREQTTWVRVSVWGKQAEAANQFLSKGRKVLVEGELSPDPETGGPKVFTRQDGSAGSSYEMRASLVRFLDSGNDSAANSSAPIAQEEDDIPF